MLREPLEGVGTTYSAIEVWIVRARAYVNVRDGGKRAGWGIDISRRIFYSYMIAVVF